ncbi:amidophosphoribosyltransferase [Stutzerimonas kirkiae]|uniref:Amidophosphoribosyltransferase n=1 Tax=Stutzerimonas kirkiae TaxID=2211392 RepID=A0A4Q9RDR8_9GAMM|nr:ComF family protein [Stutzerimonas kirkiae]TBU99358.1 amidophosphoribosyltransferase [Stutzerimonas kirkiae]TBV06182.1 amidophosphoribosyltransferase [Stutzerimonas kirkiae]
MVYNWTIIEHKCLLCGSATGNTEGVCPACAGDLPWLKGCCSVCALPLPATGLVCGQCLKRPPAYDRVVAPWSFEFPLDGLVSGFKYQARWPMGRLLAGLLAEHLRRQYQAGLPRPITLLPVPLSRRRLRQRGFNQAQMLARWLGQALGIPVIDDLLSRTRDTPPQQQLDARTRRRNLLGAFALAPDSRIRKGHLALIDDVLTTGATAQALARLLKRHGAGRVDVYCLARTPSPGQRPSP